MDHIEESAKKKRKRTNRMYCSICEKFNHNTKDCYKKQVEGVSDDINFDLGAEIGEKSEENAEAPVWDEAQKLFVVFVRERIMVNNDKCDILTVFWIQVWYLKWMHEDSVSFSRYHHTSVI